MISTWRFNKKIPNNTYVSENHLSDVKFFNVGAQLAKVPDEWKHALR